MTTAWAQLPNAQHIDWVLADVRARPDVWDAARDAAWDAAWGAAWDAAWDAARAAARNVAQDTAWPAVWAAARATARDAAWTAVWGVLLALIAYDEASTLVECDVDHLRRLYRLHPHPMYLLMQSLAVARNTK